MFVCNNISVKHLGGGQRFCGASSCSWTSRCSLHVDTRQCDVVVDAHGSDVPWAPRSVSELRHLRPVHLDFEPGVSHGDLYLEVLARSEGKGSITLLFAPLVMDLAVPHHHAAPAFVKARVKVERDVVGRA